MTRALFRATMAIAMAVGCNQITRANCVPTALHDCPEQERAEPQSASERNGSAKSSTEGGYPAQMPTPGTSDNNGHSPLSPPLYPHAAGPLPPMPAGGMGAPDPHPVVAPAMAAPLLPAHVVPVRVYLPASRIPPLWVAGYGIVAFKGLPTDAASLQRLVRVCEAFTHYLPRQDSVSDTVPVQDQMVTIWPLLDPNAAGARNDDCGYVTRNYQLIGGTLAILDARSQNANVSGRGPFLLAWSPSSTRGHKDKIVLVYDMSSLTSQDSFNQAFMFWQQQIVAKPTAWRNGLTWTQMKLVFRDFIDAHSDAALHVLHVSSPESSGH